MTATQHCKRRIKTKLSQEEIDRGFRDSIIKICGGDEKALKRYMDGMPPATRETCRYIPDYPNRLDYLVEVWPRIFTERSGDVDALLCTKEYSDGKSLVAIFKSGLTDKRWMELMRAIHKATKIWWRFEYKKLNSRQCPFCCKKYKAESPFVKHVMFHCHLQDLGISCQSDYEEVRAESLEQQREELEEQEESELFDPLYLKDEGFEDPGDWWKP